MTTAADRPSSPRYCSNRPPVSFSSYCFYSDTGLMHRSLGKCVIRYHSIHACVIIQMICIDAKQ